MYAKFKDPIKIHIKGYAKVLLKPNHSMLPIFRGFAHAISPHMTFFFKNGGRIFPWRHLAFFKVMANRDSLKNSGLFNMLGSGVLYALLLC